MPGDLVCWVAERLAKRGPHRALRRWLIGSQPPAKPLCDAPPQMPIGQKVSACRALNLGFAALEQALARASQVAAHQGAGSGGIAGADRRMNGRMLFKYAT